MESALHPVTWPEQKAPRLQQVLRLITERRGDLCLDFLGELPTAEARAWLEALSGVGPKTSAAVLAFSRLRRPVMPIDTHHHRVALRLGLLPPGTPPGPAHDLLQGLLPAGWSAQQVYDHHEMMVFHGRRVCTARSPACPRCPLLDLCPTGQEWAGARHADALTAAGAAP